MTLDLLEEVGVIMRGEDSLGDEDYFIFPGHPAYSFLWHICLSVSAMSMALAWLDEDKREVNPGDHIRIGGVALDYALRIPAEGSVRMAISEQYPPFVPLTVHHGRHHGTQEIWAEPLKRWLEQIVWPGFVNLFEHRKALIEGGDTQIVALARVVRHSCAHGGMVAMDSCKSSEVSWKTLRFTKEMNGDPLFPIMGVADFVLLALKMFDLPLDRHREANY